MFNLKWKRKLGWVMVSMAFLPVALGIIGICGVAYTRGIIIMATCQFLFVIGTALIDFDREVQFRLLKEELKELKKVK